ncbi:uncharacterized protein TNIN_134841 [Trichonephila inaurata madagascariensis]|uniref:Uncharacterized protein n=1 Tax=Trichonephila inaurata madagascariensis TaxID=2747483 RepID=A0A8X6I5K1_9ARAC|nr:uncharacterized protein TNIN_134841 [Trichonephila inaurata madagascariensis]
MSVIPPPLTQDPTKPIMLRIGKNYNMIVQKINRKFRATVNKTAGDYIKVQPGSRTDHRKITTLLEERKAEYYVTEPLTNRPIKVVIKGLPASTDVADIEADLTAKGFAIEKVTQLRKFSTSRFLWCGSAPHRRSKQFTMLKMFVTSV